MKKIVFLTISFWLLYTSAQAQQIHQLTQYMINNFAYNPAVAGSSDDWETKFTYRKQWTGINDAPTTLGVSTHLNLSEKKAVGLGAIIYSDVTGPTKRTGVQLAYAYHIPIEVDETYLGLGVSANILSQGVNFSELILADDGDVSLGTIDVNRLGADANVGAYLSNEIYWVGLAVNQLFGSKFNFDDQNATIQDAMHLYVTGGYQLFVNKDFSVEPSLLLKAVKGAPMQADINLRALYQDQYWVGFSYRTADAIAILLGLDLKSGFNLAYSFDITTSGLNAVSGGSHEISVGYDFDLSNSGGGAK